MRHFFQKYFGGFKAFLFVLAAGIGLMMHLYTQGIVNQLRDESRSQVLFYAQMYAKVTEEDFSEDLSFVFEHVIQKTTFPLIHTDSKGVPISWKGLTINPQDNSPEAIEKVNKFVEKMDREINPISIKYEDQILGYLYFGDSKLILQLQWLPYIEIGIILFFISVFLSDASR